jgi:integrase
LKRARIQNGSVVLNRKFGTWNFLWVENGRRRSRLIGHACKYATREAALKAAEPLKRMFALPTVTAPTVRSLVEAYRRERMPKRASTVRGYETWIKNHLLPAWGDLEIGDVQPRPVELWLRTLDLSPKSKVHIRGLLHLLWDYAMWRNDVPVARNPMELVKIVDASKPIRRTRSLTLEQFHALLETLGKDASWRTMLLLAVSFGLRISEVLGLKWKDVDWLNKAVSIERGVVKQIVDEVKSKHSARKMVCADELLEVLNRWRQTTQFSSAEDWVFASPYKLGKQPLSYSFVWENLSDAAKQAEIGHVSSHVFRHTYRTWLDSVGTPVGVQQKLMRHADIRTTMNIYGDAALTDMRTAHEKVVRLVLPKTM